MLEGLLVIGFFIVLVFLVFGTIFTLVRDSTIKDKTRKITKEFKEELLIVRSECLSSKVGRLRWDAEKANFIEKHILPRLRSTEKKAVNRAVMNAEIERILNEAQPKN